jgi:hypothetical protein
MPLELFVSKDHQQHFYELLARDNTSVTDGETMQLLYTIAGNSNLWEHWYQIYDCEQHCLKNYKPFDSSAASSRLLKRALHLFNGKKDLDTKTLCRSLDGSNETIVLNALRLYMVHDVSEYFRES